MIYTNYKFLIYENKVCKLTKCVNYLIKQYNIELTNLILLKIRKLHRLHKKQTFKVVEHAISRNISAESGTYSDYPN